MKDYKIINRFGNTFLIDSGSFVVFSTEMKLLDARKIIYDSENLADSNIDSYKTFCLLGMQYYSTIKLAKKLFG